MPRNPPSQCPQGHRYAGRNLRLTPDGRRHCRRCDNTRRRAGGRRANGWYDLATQARRRTTLKMARRNQARRSDPTYKARNRTRSRERYRTDADYRARMIAWASEYHADQRAAINARRRERYAGDAQYRARCNEANREQYAKKAGRPVRTIERVRKAKAG